MLTTDFANRSSKLKASQAILDGKLHGSGMSHTTTASPKPFFRAPWRVDDGVVGRRNAGWTTSKSGHPCPCQNCSPGPPAEKTSRGSLLNRPSCPSDDPVSQVAKLNCFKKSQCTVSIAQSRIRMVVICLKMLCLSEYAFR